MFHVKGGCRLSPCAHLLQGRIGSASSQGIQGQRSGGHNEFLWTQAVGRQHAHGAQEHDFNRRRHSGKGLWLSSRAGKPLRDGNACPYCVSIAARSFSPRGKTPLVAGGLRFWGALSEIEAGGARKIKGPDRRLIAHGRRTVVSVGGGPSRGAAG